MKTLGRWNRGQDHPNGCCSRSAYVWCRDNGYIVNDVYCRHPDRYDKTCLQIHGDNEHTGA